MNEDRQDWLRRVEGVLTLLSGGAAEVGTLKGRIQLAAAFGYMDAKTMVFFSETHGFPLSMSALKAAEYGLKIDHQGLRYELAMIGKKPETVASELKELRYFVEAGK